MLRWGDRSELVKGVWMGKSKNYGPPYYFSGTQRGGGGMMGDSCSAYDEDFTGRSALLVDAAAPQH